MEKELKISILMPTYNDEKYIKESINSVLEQTYKNWELIIVNDGSTDSTEKVVKSYTDERIVYLYQENSDQLNAILNGSNFITGDIVYILHSDDLIADSSIFNRIAIEFNNDNKIEAVLSSLIKIDSIGRTTGTVNLFQGNLNKIHLSTTMLNFGKNMLNDFFFAKKEVFLKKIINSYVKWNRPFWIDFDNINILNIKKIDFATRKYRVFSENYINSDLGKLNVINGNLRTLTSLMDEVDIPFFKLQRFCFRVFNKFKILSLFRPLYFKKSTPLVSRLNIYEMAIDASLGDSLKRNEYIDSFLNFYKNINDREIHLKIEIKDSEVYYGKDMRIFNKMILENRITELYAFLFSEMKRGFKRIIVKNNDEKRKMDIILKFLNITAEVVVKYE